MMVLAPATVQEAVDLTYAAFDYADRDRNPVLILADGVIGTMMEPVELPEMKSDEEVAAIKESKNHGPASVINWTMQTEHGSSRDTGLQMKCRKLTKTRKKCTNHGKKTSW